MPTLWLLLLCSRARPTLPTLPLLLSILWTCKHIGASSVGDVNLDKLYILLPQTLPPLSSSIPQAYLHQPTPLLWSEITQACHRDATASVVVPESSPPPSLSVIPRTRRLLLVLCRRLRHCSWVCVPVLLFWRRCRRHQYPEPVKTPAHTPLETFNRTHCLFCFLSRRLCCRRRDLGFILLYRPFHPCRQLIRPIIATPQPPLLSPNLQSLGHIIYSLSSAKASFVVVDFAGQWVKDYLTFGCWIHILSVDGLHL